jgi:sec-independent protein translocase protein TatB
MFDFAWSEIALIGVVALIAIGPKDMPAAIKAIAGVIKKARRMAGEFQTHVDEMMREADLHEVREQINEIRNFDIRGEVERAVDADGSLRATLASNPLEPMPQPTPASAPQMAEASSGEPSGDLPVTYTLERPADPEPESAEPAPAFIPPVAEPSPAPSSAEAEEAPAFVPPGAHRA